MRSTAGRSLGISPPKHGWIIITHGGILLESTILNGEEDLTAGAGTDVLFCLRHFLGIPPKFVGTRLLLDFCQCRRNWASLWGTTLMGHGPCWP